MGKKSSAAPSSCLKIIACGSNSTASDDDIDHNALATTTTQTKASGDKRGWSFRKKSGRHRSVSNNVTSEATTFAEKEIPQVISTDFQAPIKSTTSDEKPQLPEVVDKVGNVSALKYDGESKTSVEAIASANDCVVPCEKPKVSQVMVASDSERDSTSSEADDAVVVLEHSSFDTSADLGVVTESIVPEAESDHMAELKTFKSEGISEDGSDASVKVDEPVAVIVQASIRGFLAQQEFLQLKNVITLQAVIRGHLVRRNAVETLHCIQGISKVQALVRAHSSKALDQNCRKSEGQFSTANLLKNSFARQLLESTPKPKSVNIRCDPLSPNSAWGWLERWMSVTPDVLQKPEPIADLKNDNEVQPCHSEANVELPPVSLSDPVVSKITVDEMSKLPKSEGNHGVDLVDSHSSLPILVEKPQSCHTGEKINEDVDFIEMDANVSVISGSQVESVSLPDEAEELNGEGKKLSWTSRKDSDPAIVVTQSNFEELTSAVDPGISIIASYQNTETENPADTFSSLEETVGKTSEPGVVRMDVPSECGTELSITSTLDSPDRFGLEIPQPEPEIQIPETSIVVVDTKDEQDCETDGMSSNNMYDLPSETIRKEDVHGPTDDVSVGTVVAEIYPLVDQKSELKEDINEQDSCLEHVTEHRTEKLSPEASPKSRMTVNESQGTPSSQVSVKDKKSRIGKSGSTPKHTSRSTGKRSPANLNSDSAPRSSVEHLPKDHKSGKRRSSFGSTKSDNDQEPRDSSSHSSLPSYMQATKSAKAKAHSPRSSPDFHDKEVTSKKRQSLPGAGGRQVSPRVQRSTSDAAQGAKPNGSHPSNERKWQR